MWSVKDDCSLFVSNKASPSHEPCLGAARQFSLFPRSNKHKEQRIVERKSLYLVSEFQLACRIMKARKGTRKVKTDCITSRSQDSECIWHVSKSISFLRCSAWFPIQSRAQRKQTLHPDVSRTATDRTSVASRET
jgi:hypothetical protein